MTKPNSTALVLIIDASGSMWEVTDETIHGVNAFLAEQKALPGEATITLVTFNDQATYLWDVLDLQTAPVLTRDSYVPQGRTAMLDAMGLAIETLGARLAAMPEHQRPAQVVVAILTDGEENQSHRFNTAQIAAMVQHQTEKYAWKFLFLAANQDAVLSASRLGIAGGASLNVSASGAGTIASYRSLSKSVARGRSVETASGSGAFHFTAQDAQDYQAVITALHPQAPVTALEPRKAGTARS